MSTLEPTESIYYFIAAKVFKVYIVILCRHMKVVLIKKRRLLCLFKDTKSVDTCTTKYDLLQFKCLDNIVTGLLIISYKLPTIYIIYPSDKLI